MEIDFWKPPTHKISSNYIARGNLRNANRIKSRWNYDIHVWKLQDMKRPVHRVEQPMGCKARCNYDIQIWWQKHSNQHIARSNLWDANLMKRQHNSCLIVPNMKRPLHGAEQPIWDAKHMEFWHSCLIVATQETSRTSSGATYRMQNTMELWLSCLIVATHEQSRTSCKAPYGMQNFMKLQDAFSMVTTHETSGTSCRST